MIDRSTPELAPLFERMASEGIHMFEIPTPFAVGPVNCYLIEDDPLTIFDPGPNSGEAIIGMTTFSTMVAQWTRAPPASAAPTRPPIRAWEDDEGRPKYQVIRFQMIAPSRPAMTITRPWLGATSAVLIVSLTVWATSWPSRAPTKFMIAARIRAMRGVSARVETEVDKDHTDLAGAMLDFLERRAGFGETRTRGVG